jgi:hypothetical protein
MAPLSGIYIGKHARALAAALALGAAALSLMPGQTAYAARTTSAEPGATEPAADMPARRPTGSGTATRTIDPRARCTITRSGGHIDFYVPGTVYTRPEGQVLCGSDGQWHYYGSVERASGGGGVATRTP